MCIRDSRNLQHQPFPLPQSVEFLHVVKDTQGILFQHLVMAGVALDVYKRQPLMVISLLAFSLDALFGFNWV